jgi:SAM-dependent methyltransferase
MTETSNYYDKESPIYSERRYFGVTDTYVKYIFKKRKDLVLLLLSKVIKKHKSLTLLDIACADAIMTKFVDEAFPGSFSKFVGTDISKAMIDVARKKFSTDERYSFYTKDECPKIKFDIVFGMGYLTFAIFEEEMTFLFDRLKSDGYYICTLASKDSMFAKIKLSDKPYLKDYRTYKEYREMLQKYFEIIEEVPYGLFIPKLWAFPVIARIIQPIIERMLVSIFPDLFHEKVYLLKKKP